MAYRLLLLLVLVLAACDVSTTQQPTSTAAGLLVAWVEAGNIHLWAGDEVTTITAGDALRAYPAPDGERLAYTADDDTLHVITAAGESVLQTDSYPVIQQVGWGGDALYFNTAEPTGLGLSPRHDLYRVDVESGAVVPIKPGGRFSFSPDASQIVVIDPGRYDEAEGVIYVLDPARELLRFPAVASGTHTPFYPRIQWQDNMRFIIAIPEPDAVYSINPAETPPVALWQIDLNGEAQQTGTVPADYYGLPRQSGDRVIYLQRSTAGHDLYTASIDGRDPTLYAEGVESIPPQWVGQQFVYVDDSAYWLGQPGAPPRRWIDLDPAVISLPQVVGSTIVYITLNGDTLELRYAATGSTESTLITTLVQPVDFQAIAT